MLADGCDAAAAADCAQRIALLRTAFLSDPGTAVREAAAKALCDLAVLRWDPVAGLAPEPHSSHQEWGPFSWPCPRTTQLVPGVGTLKLALPQNHTARTRSGDPLAGLAPEPHSLYHEWGPFSWPCPRTTQLVPGVGTL